MIARRARIYDALTVLTVIVIIAVDQWTKALVVANLGPAGSGNIVALIDPYLMLDYIQNSGAAFSLFANTFVLIVLIALAFGVISYLYLRMLNSGPLLYKLIFGLIIGGALGNLIDRAHNGGYVVDFISFRIPQLHFYFAVFNVADACISVGVFLLFMFILFGGVRKTGTTETTSGTLRSKGQDVQL